MKKDHHKKKYETRHYPREIIIIITRIKTNIFELNKKKNKSNKLTSKI